MKMRVLMLTGTPGLLIMGGAEILMFNLAKGLREKNINIVLPTTIELLREEQRPKLQYDIIVFFNVTSYYHDAFITMNIAKQHNIPFIVFPIYWKLENINETAAHLVLSIVRTYMRFINKPLFRIPVEIMKLVYDNSDLIVTSGSYEKQKIVQDFGIDENRVDVLPVGVEKRFAEIWYRRKELSELAEKIFGQKDYILFVGAIEPRKNIHGLIKAYAKSNLSTLLILTGHLRSKDYLNYCLKLAERLGISQKIKYMGRVPHRSRLLEILYAGAKVLVLPSFYETPGIVAMEAALAGVNIVITKYGTTQEYYSKYVTYVDPYNVSSIAEGLLHAYQEKFDPKLRIHILNNYTWDVIAERFINILSRILK